MACYQIHNGGRGNDGTNASIGTNVCTESCYKHRVLDHCNHDNNENNLRGVLARMQNDINDNLDHAKDREERLSKLLEKKKRDEKDDIVNGIRTDVYDNATTQSQLSVMNVNKTAGSNTPIIPDEDLADLASYVLHIDDHNDEKHDNKYILESIPPQLLHAFECSLLTSDSLEGAIPEEGVLESHAPSDEIMSLEKKKKDEKHEKNEGDTSEVKSLESQTMVLSTSLWWLATTGEEEGEAAHSDTMHFSSMPTLDDWTIE